MAQRKAHVEDATFYRMATHSHLRLADVPEESSRSRDPFTVIMDELEGALQTKRRIRANLGRLHKKSDD